MRVGSGHTAIEVEPAAGTARHGDEVITTPFTFFANGAPFGRSAFARETNWNADGPGYVTLSVIDANGQSARVTVFVE